MDIQTFPDLDLKLLLAFEAICKHQSLTIAAEQLGISQSAISKYLQRMRVQLDDPLFVRAPKSMRMELTPRASAIRAPINEILRAYFERVVTSPTFDPAESERVFRIHVSDAGLAVLLPTLTRQLENSAPGCRIRAVSGNQREVLDGLEAGTIDLSISSYTNLDEVGLYQQRICEEHYTLLADPSHRLATRPGSLNFDAFVCCTHILVCAGSTGHAHGRAESLLRETIPPMNIALEVPSFMAAMLMLSGTEHLLVVPELAARALAHRFGLVTLPCPLRLPPFTVWQYWHERFALDPAARWLRNLIHAAAEHSLNTVQLERDAKASSRRFDTVVHRSPASIEDGKLFFAPDEALRAEHSARQEHHLPV